VENKRRKRRKRKDAEGSGVGNGGTEGEGSAAGEEDTGADPNWNSSFLTDKEAERVRRERRREEHLLSSSKRYHEDVTAKTPGFNENSAKRAGNVTLDAERGPRRERTMVQNKTTVERRNADDERRRKTNGRRKDKVEVGQRVKERQVTGKKERLDRSSCSTWSYSCS